jgi:hypothetical protein
MFAVTTSSILLTVTAIFNFNYFSPQGPPARVPARPVRIGLYGGPCVPMQAHGGAWGSMGSHGAHIRHELIMKGFKFWLRNCSPHELFVSALYMYKSKPTIQGINN